MILSYLDGISEVIHPELMYTESSWFWHFYISWLHQRISCCGYCNLRLGYKTRILVAVTTYSPLSRSEGKMVWIPRLSSEPTSPVWNMIYKVHGVFLGGILTLQWFEIDFDRFRGRNSCDYSISNYISTFFGLMPWSSPFWVTSDMYLKIPLFNAPSQPCII